MNSDLRDYARTSPLNAQRAHGFGPAASKSTDDPTKNLRSIRADHNGVYLACESAGTTAQRLISLLVALDGAATAEQLAFHAQHADADDLEETMSRMITGEILTRDHRTGGIVLSAAVRSLIEPTSHSLSAYGAISSDQLAKICRHLGLQAPGRKDDRIAAIVEALSDEVTSAALRKALSSHARALLASIARAAGAGVVHASSLNISTQDILAAEINTYARTDRRTALYELTHCGIVGVDRWDGWIWVWREAWPFTQTPLISDWSVAVRPAIVAVAGAGDGGGGGGTRPAAVAWLDAALELWKLTPATALRNSEPRLPKPQLKAVARDIGTSEATMDVLSRLAIGMRLLVRNVIGTSGRGRQAVVDEAWTVDERSRAAWSALTPNARWARLVAEWCNPRFDCGQLLLANRHLLAWELLSLPPGTGYADSDQFAAWFADRYGTIGQSDAALEVLGDLRALGVVAHESVALTAAGRDLLENPQAAAEASTEASATVYVQSDLTVVITGELQHELLRQLERLCSPRPSDAQATQVATYRLDLHRVIRTLQSGETEESIVGLLGDLSATPLPDTVTRLVQDAARRASGTLLVSAATVLIVSDPADLAVACAIKAIKLTKVSTTVAVSDVPAARVMAALERKGVVAQLITNQPAPTRTSDADAERAEREAARIRQQAQRLGGNAAMAKLADDMEQRARLLRDVDLRFAVPAAITLTPTMVERLAPR